MDVVILYGKVDGEKQKSKWIGRYGDKAKALNEGKKPGLDLTVEARRMPCAGCEGAYVAVVPSIQLEPIY